MGHEAPPFPSRAVLQAFGLRGTPTPLPGGRGAAWLVDDAVVKPAEVSPEQLEWEATELATRRIEGVRLSTPLRSNDGAWVVDGWSATRRVAGAHAPGRWREVVAAGWRLHDALRDVRRPAFLASRTDRWWLADRIAWGEEEISSGRSNDLIDQVAAWRRSIDSAPQLIHGDLTGNVLFEPGLPPAVIDLSLYWRPAGYAVAIVVVDGLVWEAAGPDVVSLGADVPEFGQLLVRALLFRLVVDLIDAGPRVDLAPYRETVS